MTDRIPAWMLAAAAPKAVPEVSAVYADPSAMAWPLYAVVLLGFATVSVGMLLCLYRLWRGPDLADRVLATDIFALHVVALVILLTIYLRDLTFFDAALGVSIVGFASTVGFAQYIGARNKPEIGEGSPSSEGASTS